MDDVMNRPEGEQETSTTSKRGGCLRRLLLGFVLLISVATCAFFWFTHKTRSRPPFSTALELIQNDVKLIEHIGEPISNVRWLPSGNFPSQFQIQVKGPKGMADVSVTAGEFGGVWEVTALSARVFDPSKPHETATSFPLDTGSGTGAGEAPAWPGASEAPAWRGASEAPAWPPAGTTPEGSGTASEFKPPSGPQTGPPEGPPNVNIEVPNSPPLNIEMPPVPAAPKR